MKKQILYASFVNRLFSALMDLCLLSIMLVPITSYINQKTIIYKFGDILKEKNIEITNYYEVTNILKPYLTPEVLWDISYPMLLAQLISLILYFVTFWHLFGTTPVKYLMHIRVVDKNSLSNPSIIQCCVRLFFYILAPVGIWSMFFSENKQMLHDKISGTMVIKV